MHKRPPPEDQSVPTLIVCGVCLLLSEENRQLVWQGMKETWQGMKDTTDIIGRGEVHPVFNPTWDDFWAIPVKRQGIGSERLIHAFAGH
jgi:hypothetical protein